MGGARRWGREGEVRRTENEAETLGPKHRVASRAKHRVATEAETKGKEHLGTTGAAYKAVRETDLAEEL